MALSGTPPDKVATDQAIAELRRRMDRFGKDRDSPVRAVSAYFGDRWSALILLVLGTGSWRHADLRRMLSDLSAEGAISQRILTMKLRALERDGLVDRTVSNDVPPRVSYRLSALGDGLIVQLNAIVGWINDNDGAIRAARIRYDVTNRD